MEAGANPGYTSLEVTEIVERELKSPENLTTIEITYLNEHVDLWKSELVTMKKRTEMQLTSNKARMFNLYVQHVNQELSRGEYMTNLNSEKIRKVNSARFLQQLENRIQRLKFSKLS